MTLLVAVATLVMTIVLYILIPKGFFPVQDTGVIQGISQGAQNVSFPAMSQQQQQLADVILKDPAVDQSVLLHRRGWHQHHPQQRTDSHQSQAHRGDEKISASDVIRRLQPKLAKVNNITLFMQPVQDITIEDRVSRTQYQYTLEDPDPAELQFWTDKLMAKLQTLPELRDLATDQQADGLQIALVIDRVTAARLGISAQQIDQTLYDAFGQRQVSTLFTQLNQYHLILEATPSFQTRPVEIEGHLYPVGLRRGGAVERVCPF